MTIESKAYLGIGLILGILIGITVMWLMHFFDMLRENDQYLGRLVIGWRKKPLTPEEWEKRYFVPGCTCRKVPCKGLPGHMLIGGQDDCPIHGFGPENEESDANSPT
jgi:hypothetical protein